MRILAIALAALTVLGLTGCKSDKDTAKETASTYIMERLKNLKSAKIESIEVCQDTIPFYLTHDILKLADEAKAAMYECDTYENETMARLFPDKKEEAKLKLATVVLSLQNASKAVQEEGTIECQYVAYVKSSWTNSFDTTSSSSDIIVIDLKDPTKVLGCYTIDSDFKTQFMTIKASKIGNTMRQNKYGKFEIDNALHFEQFILDALN